MPTLLYVGIVARLAFFYPLSIVFTRARNPSLEAGSWFGHGVEDKIKAKRGYEARGFLFPVLAAPHDHVQKSGATRRLV